MSRDKIHLEVLTPEQAVLAEDVESVVLPAEDGQLGVLPGHMPLMTGLDVGEMVVHTEDDQASYFLAGGFAEVLTDRVRVLAQECEGVDEIDVEQARARIEETEREVENLESADEEGDEELVEKYRESLKKDRQRLMVSGESDDE